MSRSWIVVAGAAALLAVAGCTSDGPAPTPGASSRAPTSGLPSTGATGSADRELAAAWSVDVPQAPFRVARPADYLKADEGPNLVVVGDRVLFLGGDEVVALDLATGAGDWTTRLPQAVCATAPTTTAPGVAAVLVGVDGDCTDVVAIDTETGRTLWTAPVPRAARAVGHEVQVGPQVVVVSGECAGWTSFGLADGSVAADVPGRDVDGQCVSAASDGTLVATSSQGGRLATYDAATGARRSIVSVTGLGRIGDVLTSDPLVVTGSTDGGGDFLDLSAAAPRLFGPEDGATFGGVPQAAARVGDDLWSEGVRERVVNGYDLATGKGVGTVELGSTGMLVGTHDDLLVITSELATGSGRRAELLLLDPTGSTDAGARALLPEPRPDDGKLVGWVVSGDYLVRVWTSGLDAGRVEAIRLPAASAGGAGSPGGV